MKKILFIAYYYPPLGGGGVQRTVNFVKYLPDYGYDPIILTGPALLNSDRRWQPLDIVLAEQTGENVKVDRIRSQPKDSANNLEKRLRRLLSLPDVFSSWWTRQVKIKAEQILQKERFHLIFATMSPYASAKVASELSRKYQIPWVADLRDPWALDEVEVYPSIVHRWIERYIMRRVLRTASAIVMNTPEAEKKLRKTFPIFQKKRTVVITNGYDPFDFIGSIASEKKSKFRVVHSGYFYTDLGLTMQKKKTLRKILGGHHSGVDLFTRSPYYLIKALEHWARISPEVIKNIEIHFLGKLSDSDLQLIRQSPISSQLVQNPGYVPHSENLRYLRSADLLFLAMHNLSNGDRATTVYGKTYEYMATGTPILAAVPEGDARDFLDKCGTAFLCKPDDWKCMVDVLNHTYSAWQKGERTVRLNTKFLENFNRKILAQKLASALDQCSA